MLGVMLRQSELVTAGLRCDTLDMSGASGIYPGAPYGAGTDLTGPGEWHPHGI